VASLRFKHGSWHVLYRDEDGRSRSVIGGKTEREARKVMAQIEQRLAVSAGLRDGRSTFGEVAEDWFACHVTPRLSPQTAKDYQSAFDAHLLPEWGDKPIRRITNSDVQRFWVLKNSLPRSEGGISRIRLNKIRIPLRGMCSWAVAEGYLLASPAADLKAFKVAKPQMSFLTLDEAERLIAATDPYYRPHVMTLIYMGLRFGELKSMSMSSVVLSGVEGAQMHVRCGGVEKGEFLRTKTSESDRWIGIPDFLAQELADHFGRLSETPNPLGLAFPTRKGAPLDNSTFRNRVIHPALESAGLKHIRIHDLRHTYASLLLLNGATLYDAQRLLGHTDPKTTLRYSHFTKGAASRAASVLSEARALHQKETSESL